MITSGDAEKYLTKFKTHEKNTQQTGNRRNYLDLIKVIYKKPLANIILNGEKLKAFPLRLEQGKNSHSHYFYSTQFWKSQSQQSENKKREKASRLERKN